MEKVTALSSHAGHGALERLEADGALHDLPVLRIDEIRGVALQLGQPFHRLLASRGEPVLHGDQEQVHRRQAHTAEEGHQDGESDLHVDKVLCRIEELRIRPLAGPAGPDDVEPPPYHEPWRDESQEDQRARSPVSDSLPQHSCELSNTDSDKQIRPQRLITGHISVHELGVGKPQKKADHGQDQYEDGHEEEDDPQAKARQQLMHNSLHDLVLS
mmetsp:Transcript_24925/g.57958  ORF Transcript_24925/g.57958 Transcript_24925/m.57958 type:complete len:215 (-) Transcript_24925:279-923(-)